MSKITVDRRAQMCYTDMEVGNMNNNTHKIVRAMRQRRITVTELAKRIGRPRTFVSQLLYTPLSREMAEQMMNAIERDEAAA